MKIEFIIGKKLHRDKFINEKYTGEDNIFALVEKGSFTSTYNDCTEEVSALEGYCFTEGVYFERKVRESLSVFLFRYKSEEPLFPTGKIVFNDKERIRSTIGLLNQASHNLIFDGYESNYVLFYDMILQYKSEHPGLHIENSKDNAVFFAKEYLTDNLKNKIDFVSLASECGLSYIQTLQERDLGDTERLSVFIKNEKSGKSAGIDGTHSQKNCRRMRLFRRILFQQFFQKILPDFPLCIQKKYFMIPSPKDPARQTCKRKLMEADRQQFGNPVLPKRNLTVSSF